MAGGLDHPFFTPPLDELTTTSTSCSHVCCVFWPILEFLAFEHSRLACLWRPLHMQ